ncbi:hypothetical protein ACRW2M_24280, partial [Escherichia coli]
MSDTLEDMIYRRTLSCGTIQVTRDQGDVSLDDLFDIAERRNPKRAFLGTVAKLAMRQPFVLFKGLTFQKLCLPGAFRPG